MLDVLGILPHTHTHLVCASHARAHLPSQVRTEELFEMLNALYTAFDDLVDRHGVHKVDTIGDGEGDRESQRQCKESDEREGGWGNFKGPTYTRWTPMSPMVSHHRRRALRARKCQVRGEGGR